VPISSTKRALIAITVLVCIAAVGSGIYVYRLRRAFSGTSAGQVPEILGQLPSNSPGIAYIDVAALRKLHDSPLAAILGLANVGPQSRDRDYNEFVRDTGFDYARDLDRAAVAFWPGDTEKADHNGDSQRLLVIADGRFNEQKIAAYARRLGRITESASASIYKVPGNPPVSFRFVSPTRIALVSGEHAEELLAASPSVHNPAAEPSIGRVAGAPIFAVVQTDHLPKDFYENLGKASQLEPLARSVQSLTLAGQPQGDRIVLALDVECDSVKSSLEVATLLQFSRIGAAMALADPKTKRQMTAEQALFLERAVNQLKVTHQDRLVRLQLELTPQILAVATSPNPAVLPKKSPY
jgi:hypothetical protein